MLCSSKPGCAAARVRSCGRIDSPPTEGTFVVIAAELNIPLGTALARMRAAMEKADFPSVRGSFAYGKNHFPIQNFYLREVF